MYTIDFDHPVPVHFIGIGGISMSGLAEILLGRQFPVTGSDLKASPLTDKLAALGAKIAIGHDAANIPEDCAAVVYTAAVHPDNPEYAEAVRRGIPLIARAVLLGQLMKNYPSAIAVAGTHGKTTTTSMCTHINMAADRDPTVMIGGTLPLLHSGHRVGHGNTIIMEACEYYNSFLSFHPTIAVILNIEADHLDFFKDLDDIKRSFRTFAERTSEDGTVIVNLDDPNAMEAIEGIDRHIMTFGLTPKADVYAKNISYLGENSQFDIYYHGRKYTDVTLHVPGEHNIKNALAAAAASICLGIRPNAVKYGLAGFNGAGRRFEFKGKFNGADVYDDYAHHPGELRALLDMVETLNYKRTVVVFQPHTYTRTAALFDDFIAQLRRPDVVLLAEIFAAREKNTIGISSSQLAEQIPGANFYPGFDGLENALRSLAQPGDIILTVGAGDVYRVGERLVAETKE